MCGRYGLIPSRNFFTRFKIKDQNLLLKTRYNVTPQELMPVITKAQNNRLELMKWGLIPYWVEDQTIGYKLINAWAEPVAEKPSFKRSFLSRRCLVPASGFYEWQKTDSGKLPYYMYLKNKDLFSFAGLFDLWRDPSGKEVKTYTIITTIPNKLLEPIHSRMPVILKEENEDDWLSQGQQDLNKLQNFLKPYSEGEMEAYPVSTLVNKPNNDSEELIKPVKQLSL